MLEISGSLTIFEGPDGSGKSTAAKRLRDASTGSLLIHHGPYPNVKKGLGRLYIESIMPAVVSGTHVILDRSWISEEPYGMAFRDGENRIGTITRRLIERLALRCSAQVIIACPSWEAVAESYKRRKNIEMLENEVQLHSVYSYFNEVRFQTDLPWAMWDYETNPLPPVGPTEERSMPHLLAWKSAGNVDASTLIVGEGFAAHADYDTYYQWPFGALSGAGSSRWLTRVLNDAEIPEKDLFWASTADTDENLKNISDLFENIIALGNDAARRMMRTGRKFIEVPHPQFHRRFNNNDPYELIDAIRNVAHA